MKSSPSKPQQIESNHLERQESEPLDLEMSLIQTQINKETLDEIFEEEKFQRGLRNHIAQEKARARFQELEDKQNEDAYFELLIRQTSKHHPLNLALQQSSENSAISSIKIENACEIYLAARKVQITEGTYRTWKSCLNKLIKAFPQREINTITKSNITDLISNPLGGKSQGTITKDADTWNLMFDWLVKHDLAIKNPVIKPTFGRAQSARLKNEHGKTRLIYSDEDLKKLFSVSRLDSLKRPEAVWLPLLGLATGARLESLARLKVSDITEKTIKFAVQFDKTGIGRIIPIHPLLINAGLLTYKKEIEDEFGQDSYLFTAMNEVKGRRSHYFSKMFGAQRNKLGIETGKDFHSFRTTLISKLNKSDVSGAVRRVYVGHDVGEIVDVDDLHYSKEQYTTDELAERIFPHLVYDLCGWKYTKSNALHQITKLKTKKDKKMLQTERKEKKVKVNKKRLANRQEIQRIVAEKITDS